MSTTTITTKTVIKLKESRKLFTHPVSHAEKQTTPQRNVILEPMQPIDRLSGTEDQKDRIRSQKEPPKVTLRKQIEERLVRDDSTNELYMPLSSTIVLKRKKKMLCVPLDFKNGLTIDALVDSGAYVIEIAQKKLDRIKQQSPSNILKIYDPPLFQIQVANGQQQPHSNLTLGITPLQNILF